MYTANRTYIDGAFFVDVDGGDDLCGYSKCGVYEHDAGIFK